MRLFAPTWLGSSSHRRHVAKLTLARCANSSWVRPSSVRSCNRSFIVPPIEYSSQRIEHSGSCLVERSIGVIETDDTLSRVDNDRGGVADKRLAAPDLACCPVELWTPRGVAGVGSGIHRLRRHRLARRDSGG